MLCKRASLGSRFQTAPTGEKSLDFVLWVEGWRGTGPRPTFFCGLRGTAVCDQAIANYRWGPCSSRSPDLERDWDLRQAIANYRCGSGEGQALALRFFEVCGGLKFGEGRALALRFFGVCDGAIANYRCGSGEGQALALGGRGGFFRSAGACPPQALAWRGTGPRPTFFWGLRWGERQLQMWLWRGTGPRPTGKGRVFS